MSRKPFLLIVTDSDRGIFNVLGPMFDDTPCINRVVECQRQNRHVNCHTPPGTDKEQTALDYAAEYGHKFVAPSVLLLDESAINE